jgi:hypothetical protein
MARASCLYFMKMPSLVLIVLVALAPLKIFAQARPGDFRVTRITKNLISAPQYTYTGAQQYQTDQNKRWLEVEAEFAAGPEFTDELTLKYFILINGSVLTGEVTHANIKGGPENRSVMYVSPDALGRVLNNRPATTASVQNIAVQIVQQGAVKDELNLIRAPAQWYTTVPALIGLVLNKSETPFAPLYWDRYPQIKKGAR